MVKINPLETQDEINEYKEWLASKSLHFLKCLTHNFRMDESREEPIYPKIQLRMELLQNEINRRQRKSLH